MTADSERREFLTLAEIAAELRVTRRFLSNLAARGELPAYKIGRVWRVARADYLAWLKKQRSAKLPTVASVASRISSTSDHRLERLPKLTLRDFERICKK